MENSFFTIQQISNKTGLSVHTLRYYEKIGLLTNVERDENSYRLYKNADLLWIQFLIRLKETGMPISEMKYFSDLRSQGDDSINPRRKLLEAHQKNIRKQIDNLTENLQKIEEKIELYKEMEEVKERRDFSKES